MGTYLRFGISPGTEQNRLNHTLFKLLMNECYVHKSKNGIAASGVIVYTTDHTINKIRL